MELYVNYLVARVFSYTIDATYIFPLTIFSAGYRIKFYCCAQVSDSVALKRAFSEGLDEILGQEYKILDKGFIRVIDYMGNDSSIVQAARVSYGKGTKTVRQDKGLIQYLMRHKHTTPFEMCEIKFHIKMPMFIARQWIRHRTASINEYSARYSILEDEFYIPETAQVCYQSTTNSQGRGEAVAPEMAQSFVDNISKKSDELYSSYLDSIEAGVAREIARIGLPLNTYTEMYWKMNLHNLLHFLKLRSHESAQYEIREYAEEIEKIVALWVPITYEAYEKYMKNSVTLSHSAFSYLRDYLKDQSNEPNPENYEMGKREFLELKALLDKFNK